MEVLKNMAVEAQITFIIAASLLILMLIVLIIKNKPEIKTRNISLSFLKKGKEDNRISLAGNYLDEKLPQLRQVFFEGYLKLLKAAGCPDDILNETDDAQFVDQMLGNIVWSGNGIKSIKSVITKKMLDGSFWTVDSENLIRSLSSSIEQNAKTYINKNYKTKIICPDLKFQRKRLVSNTVWVDSLEHTVKEMRPDLDDLINYSRSLYKDGKK